MLIEVVLRWGRDVVEVRHLDDSSLPRLRRRDCARFTVGTRATDDLFVPLADAASTELLARTPHGWILRPLDGGAPVLVDDSFAGASWVVGSFTVRVQRVARAHRLMLAPVFDALWANVATLTMFATAALVALAVLLPKQLDDTEHDVVAASPRFMALVLRPPPPKSPVPVTPSTDATESTKPFARAPSPLELKAADAARPKAKRADEQIVAAKLAALFGDGATAVVTGASGSAFAAALDGVAGHGVATAGLDLKSGPSSSSSSTGTFAIGAIATRRANGGDSAYTDGTGTLGAREDRDVSVAIDAPPVVTGALDKELIRKVVRDHMGQVRACYERGLQADAGLAGKVVLRWTITSDGKVAQAAAERSAPADGLSSVGDCIARAARTWRFPAPRGSGTVVVAYPFVFKST